MLKSVLSLMICAGGISARSTPQRVARSTLSQYGEEGWRDNSSKTTIRAENEVEAHREANNYKVG